VPFERDGVTMPAFAMAPPTLAHFLAHFSNQNKDVPFLVDGDVRMTFGEAYAAATCVAESLARDHGIAKGDRIGIAARNSANWIIAYMGVVMAGGCATHPPQRLLVGRGTGLRHPPCRMPDRARRCRARGAPRRA